MSAIWAFYDSRFPNTICTYPLQPIRCPITHLRTESTPSPSVVAVATVLAAEAARRPRPRTSSTRVSRWRRWPAEADRCAISGDSVCGDSLSEVSVSVTRIQASVSSRTAMVRRAGRTPPPPPPAADRTDMVGQRRQAAAGAVHWRPAAGLPAAEGQSVAWGAQGCGRLGQLHTRAQQHGAAVDSEEGNGKSPPVPPERQPFEGSVPPWKKNCQQYSNCMPKCWGRSTWHVCKCLPKNMQPPLYVILRLNTRTGKGEADSALPSCFLWISSEVFVRSPWFFQYLPKNKRRTFWCKNWRRVDFWGSIFKPPSQHFRFSPNWCHDGGVLAPPPPPHRLAGPGRSLGGGGGRARGVPAGR